MPWFVLPLALLMVAALGLVHAVRSYKASNTIPAKSLVAVGALIYLGGGVFLAKAGVVDVPELRRLAASLEPETPGSSDVDAGVE